MNRNYPLLLIIVMLIFICSSAPCVASIHPNANSYFPFLKLSYDARSVGMGRTSCAMPNALYGAISNPAALAFIQGKEIFVSYSPIILDIASGAFGYAANLGDRGMVAFHCLYLSGGDIELKNDQNEPLPGILSPFSIAGGVSWSNLYFSRIACGITLKGIYDRLSDGVENLVPAYSADGFAADIGMQYITLSARLLYGVAFRNIGFIRSTYSEETEKTSLPLSMSAGVSYIPKTIPYIRYAGDIEKPIDDYLQYRAGVEITAYRQLLFIRGGYMFNNEDLRAFLSMVRNGSFEDDHTKSNWSLLSLGIGIVSAARELHYSVDSAMNLRTHGMDPEFILSLKIAL